MDYGDYYWGLYRGYYRDPFPDSLLSTTQFCYSGSFLLPLRLRHPCHWGPNQRFFFDGERLKVESDTDRCPGRGGLQLQCRALYLRSEICLWSLHSLGNTHPGPHA